MCFTSSDVHHVHQFYPREERFSMIEENIHLIEEEINEFGDERSQITFEDLNLVTSIFNFILFDFFFFVHLTIYSFKNYLKETNI